MRLRHLHVEAALAVLHRLAGLEAHHATRIGVDLAEQPQLDRAREEAVLLAGEGAALGLLHVPLREVGDQIRAEPDVEEELAGPAALGERERLVRARIVAQGGRRRGRVAVVVGAGACGGGGTGAATGRGGGRRAGRPGAAPDAPPWPAIAR